MALEFPTPSGPGDSFVASNGYTYRWDGYKWSTIIGGTTSLLKLYQTEEAIQVLTNSTATVEHNCLTQNIFYHTNLAGNFNVDLINFTLDPLYATAVTIILDQGNTAYSINEVRINGTTSSVYWIADTVPEGNPDLQDVISLSILNRSSTSTDYVVYGQQISFG
jgi:hypothetical protein